MKTNINPLFEKPLKKTIYVKQAQEESKADIYPSSTGITLIRTVKARSYKALATMFISEERTDIKKILEQVQNGLELSPRLINFLTVSKLYANNEITKLGHNVLKTGFLLSKERGIYEIWYINDTYFGKKPVAIQRVIEPSSHQNKSRGSQLHNWSQAEKPQKSEGLDVEKASIYLINEKKLCDVTNFLIEVVDSGSVSKSTEINIKLDTPLDNANSEWLLSGKIATNNKGTQSNNEFEIKIVQTISNQLLEAVCDHLEFTWNSKYNRASISTLESSKYLLDFNIRQLKLRTVRTQFGEFKQGTIKNLPIMPKDNITALKWQDEWLYELYKDKHISPDNMKYQQQAWLKHDAIKHFNLPLFIGGDAINKLNGEKRNNEVYWHATTSHYLIPKFTKITLPSFTLTNKEAINVNDLLRRLTLNNKIDSIIYSDRHYKSKLHVKNLQAIENHCKPIVGVVFTTDSNVKVPNAWDKELVTNNRENHDRYYIFVSSEDEVFSWKCSTSLDFADLSKKQGFTNGNCTFTRLRKTELPVYLQESLSKINKEVLV